VRTSKLFFCLVMAFAMTMTSTAFAQTHTAKGFVGAVGGYHFKAEVPLIGLDALMIFATPVVPVSIHPSFNYFFIESQELLGFRAETTLLQFDLDGLVHVPLGAPVTPYLGAGVAMVYTRVNTTGWGSDVTDTETTFGANFLAGLAVEANASVHPFAQLRATILEETSLSMLFGVRFGF
jgi:hypothetical protein